MRRIVTIAIVLFVLLIGLLSIFFIFKANHKNHELTLYGNVDVRQVDISFRVPGQIKDLYFEEGEFVKKGQKMALLDDRPYLSQYKEAQNRADSICFRLENSEKILKRSLELIGVGGVSEQELDNSLAQNRSLGADLKAANDSAIIAKDNLSFTEVFAPSDGIVFTRVREVGSVVRESEPVFTLSLISPVWVRAYIQEPMLGVVKYGDRAKIYTDVAGGRVYEGKVGFISPMAEFTPKTVETASIRTDLVYRIRIYVDDPDGSLKQGMPVTVKLWR